MKRAALHALAAGFCCLFVFCLLTACGDAVFREQTAEDITSFKTALEELNDVVDEDGTPLYTPLTIPEDHPAVVLTYDEMREFLSRGSGLLLFSRPGCPWCRLLLPTLLEFAAAQEVYLYTYDPEAIRAANDDDYKALVAELDAYLAVDTVTQEEDSPDFDPGRKRLYLPHLFFLEKGEIRADYCGMNDPLLEAGDTAAVQALLAEKYAAIE